MKNSTNDRDRQRELEDEVAILQSELEACTAQNRWLGLDGDINTSLSLLAETDNGLSLLAGTDDSRLLLIKKQREREMKMQVSLKKLK